MTGLLRRHRPALPQPVSRSGARQAAARALEEEALRTGPALAGHPAVAELGGMDAALRCLHRRWVTRLGVEMDEALEAEGTPVVEAAWAAWGRLAGDCPGLASILSAYGRDPVVIEADDRHRRLVAGASGCDARRLPSFRAAPGPVPPAGRRAGAVPAGVH